jgi:hypothetical protein
MKRVVFNFVALVLLTAFSACNNEQIIPDPDDPEVRGAGNISLKVYVPKGSISTYAEDASEGENRIDTLFVELWQEDESSVLQRIESDTFAIKPYKDSHLTPEGGDSTWRVQYDADGLTQGKDVIARVYANRKDVNIIHNGEEIETPSTVFPTPPPPFLMTGEEKLTYGATAYTGTVHIARNVAKLRINVTRDAVFLPSDLEIVYPGIRIQALNVADRTSLFESVTPGAATGVTYINYNERPARCALTVGSNGGLLDSLYLYENYRTGYTVDVNTTQVKVTIPTHSVLEGDKTDSYTYTIRTNGSYDILRNYIYTLDIKVRGQSLEPLISLNMQPWNDVNLDGSILGTYLTMQTSEIEFNADGYAEVAFCTDAQAVYVDYSEFNDNNTVKIGNEIKTVNIQPTDPNLAPNDLDHVYQGQVLVDKRVCTSFGFQIDPLSGIKPNSLNFSGKICIRAGNIVKCISFVGQRIYDAHYIVGENLLNTGDLFTSAIVDTEGSGKWLQVSPQRLFTGDTTTNYTGAAIPLYLHLAENLTGDTRKGSITVLSNNVEKKIYIQQLSAIPIGRFGYEGANADDTENYNRQLYLEQLYESSPMSQYKDASNASLPTNNNVYNGLGTARANFDQINYKLPATPFNWKDADYRAINYCAYKNRDENLNGVIDPDEIKWYLPSQAQLMAMWVTYEAYKNAPFSNFKAEAYWSSTNNERYPKEAQCLNFIYGNVGHYKGSEEYWTRCVRNGEPLSNNRVHPTTCNLGAIMYVNDLPQELIGDWNSNRVNANENAEVNKKFYSWTTMGYTYFVDNPMTWDEAMTVCGGSLPTQRELQLAWLSKSAIEALDPSFKFKDDYYWTSTESSTHPTDAYMVWMGSGSAGDLGNTPHIVKTHKARARCVDPC